MFSADGLRPRSAASHPVLGGSMLFSVLLVSGCGVLEAGVEGGVSETSLDIASTLIVTGECGTLYYSLRLETSILTLDINFKIWNLFIFYNE